MQHNETRQGRTLKLAVLVCAAIAVTLWAGPYISRVDLFANDAAQHIFWLYRYADPSLFPNDLTARFFSLPSSAPWGYRGLYASIAPFVDVLFAAEIFAAGLLVLSTWLAWLIGRAVVSEEDRELAGLVGAVALLWLVAQHSDAMTPLALQRSFALPLTLLLLWALIVRRYVWVGVALLCSALIYPVIIVVLGLAAAIAFLDDIVRNRRLPPRFIWNCIAGGVALAIVVATIGVPPDIGPTVTGSQALSMPEFGFDGRLRLFAGTFTGDWFHSQLIGLGWSPACLLVIAAAAVLSILGGRNSRVPRAVWILLCCGVGVWLVARFAMFRLYLPNRHARWAIAAFAVPTFASAGVVVVQYVARQAWGHVRATQTAISVALPLVAVLVVVAVFLPAAIRVWQRPVDHDMERAYAYLATLPRDTLIAAHPDLADFVPLRSHRMVLASTETSLPFMQGYYQRIKPRLAASLRAAYASSWEELDAALEPYGATVMLSGPAVWSKDRYYEPFNALVSDLRSRGGRTGFVLQKPNAQRVLFRSGEVYVLRVGSTAVARAE